MPKKRILGAAICFYMFLYCVVLLLVFDLIYLNLFAEAEDGAYARIRNARYHHGLAANFHGYDRWGDIEYPLYTNSLGFKDAAVRNILPKSDVRRILSIGDSFTEGLGVSFEDPTYYRYCDHWKHPKKTYSRRLWVI